jgi:hypothetical protein
VQLVEMNPIHGTGDAIRQDHHLALKLRLSLFVLSEYRQRPVLDRGC